MPATRRRRIITDQRREQNRQAQFRYREKVRTRLRYVEQMEQFSAPKPNTSENVGHNITQLADQPWQPLNNVMSGSQSSGDLSRSGSTAATAKSSNDSFTIQPYLSDLRLDAVDRPYISLISACVENSKLLGIPNIFMRGLQSLFYNEQQNVSNGDENNSVDRWNHLPRDLYPTPLQLITPHEAWLDCIPLPEFRDGIFTHMSSIDGNDLNSRRELEDDVHGDGLVCWGGCSDDSLRASTCAGTFGTPWDSRSWEARPWFLKKWKHITGGLDGSLGANSVWWWSLRDEEIPDPF